MTHIPGLLIVRDDFLVIAASKHWADSDPASAGGSAEDGFGEGCTEHGELGRERLGRGVVARPVYT